MVPHAEITIIGLGAAGLILLKEILNERFLFLFLSYRLFDTNVILGLINGKLDTKYSSDKD